MLELGTRKKEFDKIKIECNEILVTWRDFPLDLGVYFLSSLPWQDCGISVEEGPGVR